MVILVDDKHSDDDDNDNDDENDDIEIKDHDNQIEVISMIITIINKYVP